MCATGISVIVASIKSPSYDKEKKVLHMVKESPYGERKHPHGEKAPIKKNEGNPH